MNNFMKIIGGGSSNPQRTYQSTFNKVPDKNSIMGRKNERRFIDPDFKGAQPIS